MGETKFTVVMIYKNCRDAPRSDDSGTRSYLKSLGHNEIIRIHMLCASLDDFLSQIPDTLVKESRWNSRLKNNSYVQFVYNVSTSLNCFLACIPFVLRASKRQENNKNIRPTVSTALPA